MSHCTAIGWSTEWPATRLTVLLHIHGITSSSATWDTVIPVLVQHAHVIPPDLLGHGYSDKPSADYSLSAFASELRVLLEYLGHERVTIVGHSLGGGVAMQFAYQYFEHCERLVLAVDLVDPPQTRQPAAGDRVPRPRG
jgi:pimeloyl-ACP methyl ester carboxylesterase